MWVRRTPNSRIKKPVITNTEPTMHTHENDESCSKVSVSHDNGIVIMKPTLISSGEVQQTANVRKTKFVTNIAMPMANVRFPSAVGGNPYNEGNGLCAKKMVPASHAGIVNIPLNPIMIMRVGCR
ncbi:unnamed protein product [Phytophthora lilii]|uniref:Unnamed protein product n=1 Tax=Phytophthora lilii TaxID=2077276 RepID=A0A9W6TIC4_9STRA|nr:unnamed protein product [Phytophthora lilii]